MDRKTIVVALGGNAIIEEGTEGTENARMDYTKAAKFAKIDGPVRHGRLRIFDHAPAEVRKRAPWPIADVRAGLPSSISGPLL